MLRLTLTTGETAIVAADSIEFHGQRVEFVQSNRSVWTVDIGDLAAIQALSPSRERALRTAKQYPNAGHPWTEEDDQLLEARYAAGASLGKLAAEFQRTTGAIRSRLSARASHWSDPGCNHSGKPR